MPVTKWERTAGRGMVFAESCYRRGGVGGLLELTVGGDARTPSGSAQSMQAGTADELLKPEALLPASRST